MPFELFEVPAPPVHDDDLVVVRDESIPRGAHRFDKAGAVHLHPLDAIALEYEGDPHGQVHAACAWIAANAHRDLDALAAPHLFRLLMNLGYAGSYRLSLWQERYIVAAVLARREQAVSVAHSRIGLS